MPPDKYKPGAALSWFAVTSDVKGMGHIKPKHQNHPPAPHRKRCVVLAIVFG